MIMEVLIERGIVSSKLVKGFTALPQKTASVRVCDKGVVLKSTLVVAAMEHVNAKLQGCGRLLVRPSGTENVIRVMVESSSEKLNEECCSYMVKALECACGGG
jgi:phosphoglucosamine mutase